MLANIYNKLNSGIRQYGFKYYFKVKITEKIYNFKFRYFKLDYSEKIIPASVLNELAVNKDARLNQASPYYEIERMFSVTGMPNSDIYLLDLGCGFGKVLNWGMIYNFNKVVGIDLDQSAIDKAIANCNKLKERGYTTNFDVIAEDATTYDIPFGVNMAYVANSFGKKTLKAVLDKLILYSKINNNKQVFIAYYIPIHCQLFSDYKEITKVFERFIKNKTEAEMAIFRIN